MVSYTTHMKVINLNRGDIQSKAIISPAGIAPSLYAGECRYGGGELYVIVELSHRGSKQQKETN